MTAMTWIRNWFGLDDEPSLKQVQDDHRINWSPDLIPHLKHDHAGLLKLYGEIEGMAKGGKYAGIGPALKLFKSKFDLHVLTENVKFYCYLEEKFGRRPGALKTIKDFRGEMNAIARGVVNFVRKWSDSGVKADTGAAFLAELGQVGALLVQRVQREENELYTLYIK